MAWIDVSYDFTTYTGNVIAVWYNNAQPTVEIGRKVIDGNTVPKSGSFRADNLQPVMHLFRYYTSANGTTLDAEILNNLVKAGRGGSKIKFYHYVVDGPGTYDPQSGQADINDARLADIPAADMGVAHRGTAFRHPGTDYVAKTSGGISLLNGEVFLNKDKWTIIVTEVNDVAPISISDYTGVNVINASETFADKHKNKKNFVVGIDGETIVLSIDDLQLQSNCRASFSTAGMKARYFRIQLANDNYTSFNTGHEDVDDVNYITLRKSEFLEFFIEGNDLYVVDYKGAIHLVGQPALASKKLLNHELADGSGPYQIAEWQDLIDRIPAEMIVTNEVTWNETVNVSVGLETKTYAKNKGKFYVNAGAGIFYFPLWQGQTFRALKNGVDASMLSPGAGGMWPQSIINHNHDYNPNDTSGKSDNANDRNVMIPGSRTSTTFSANNSSTEQRVDSTGFYAQFRI